MKINKKWCIIIFFTIILILFLIFKKYIFINDIKEHKDYFSKTYNRNSSFHPYFTPKEKFLLETYCLQKLKYNYKCTCQDKERTHFPIILNKLISKRKVKLSKCGISLEKMSHNQINEFGKINFSSQIYCILENLKKNNIVHKDIKLQNMTIQEDGSLGLIDFELAEIKDHCHKQLKRKKLYIKQLNKYNSYDQFKHILDKAMIGNATHNL